MLGNGLVGRNQAVLGHVRSGTVVHRHVETCRLNETNGEGSVFESVLWNLHCVNTCVVDLLRCDLAHFISYKMLWSLPSCETGDRVSALTGFGSDKRACHWAVLPEVGVPRHKD